jgi:hypothetical protein
MAHVLSGYNSSLAVTGFIALARVAAEIGGQLIYLTGP